MSPRRTGIDKSVVKDVVRSGAGRPAAMARKKKHDQRTPLPPKGAIKPGTAERNNARLRKAAKSAEVEAAVEKATAFIEFAKEHDWWTKLDYDASSGKATVTCKRDDGRYKEQIVIEWIGSRLASGGVLYTNVGTGRSILLRNVSAARKHMDGTNPVKRDAQPRKVKRTRTGEDGQPVPVQKEYKPVGADVIDKWYDVKVSQVVNVRTKSAAMPKAKKVTQRRKVVAVIENVGKPQVDSLRQIFEADGCTVEATERSA